MTKYNLDPWIEGYLDYMRDVKKLKARTIIDVRCTLKKVSRHAERSRPGVPLWKVSLDDYLNWLNWEREKGATETALAKDLSHIRGLLDYAWRSGRSDRNVLDGFSLQANLRLIPPKVLTLEEARFLVQAYGQKNAQERRMRLIILLLYGCGLRTFELCNLDVQDIDVERQEIFVKRGKGDRQRRIPVPPAVWTELLAYLAHRRFKRGPLFRTEIKHRRIRSKDVSAVVETAVQRTHIRGDITPKTLRHSFGTHLMDRGVDLAVIASLMGHRSPNETGVYLHVLPGRREDAVNRLAIDNQGGAK